MVTSLVRRLLASALLLVVAGGGGGMPVLDALAFHGPSRLSESLRTHYEASSSCHGDGCSIRSDAAPRVLGDHAPQAPRVVAAEQIQLVPVGESVPRSGISLQYLSRAPPTA
jgi:hypothetical protein